MKLGAMNNPHKDLMDEIRWIGEHGFDFIDLTLEPPTAMAEVVDVQQIRDLTAQYGLSIVGHTTPFLPFSTPYENVRRQCVEVIIRSMDVFADLGVSVVNMHVNHSHGAQTEEQNIQYNYKSFQEAGAAAQERGLRLMLEHFGATYAKVENLRKILDVVPGIGFHLDIGHANLWQPRNWTDELLKAFGDRLCHVHVSDNRGGDRDEHLPLGAGNIDWRWAVGILKKHGYDGTITAEVFSPDREMLLNSIEKLRRLWEEVPSAA